MMRYLIVDDEEPARSEMRRLLSRIQPSAEIAEAPGIDRALELYEQFKPRIIFLDVQLRGESGFDFLGRATGPLPPVVFVTGYDKFAVRAFECNAMDYLVKPVEAQRLTETLRRAGSSIKTPRPPARETDSVFLRLGSTSRFVPWTRILWIEAEGNYSRVHLADGGQAQVLRTLKEWLELAPERLFILAHRTAIVRVKSIAEVVNLPGGSRQLRLGNGAEIPVGRTRWTDIQTALGI
jgi:two-component system LytT family response regulator